MSLRTPTSGRIYELVADIAQGGMGKVELVVRREGTFARVYAMKRLRPELSEDAEIRRMFLEEARIAGLIRHPNVVPVLDVGEDELGPYLVMDFVEGVAAWKPLVTARSTGKPLPIAFCVEVARQAAHGLAAAHELEGASGRALDIVHRDISPQNLLLGFDGLVRVTDFGVARALDRHEDDGVVRGKMGYMSPEQAQGERLDGRADLFALGVVLHELLVSQRLYAGRQDDAFRRILHEIPPDVRSLRPEVPDALAELVATMLAKEREDRPATARLVAARLDDIAGQLRAAGETVSLGPMLRESFPEERERQRALIAAALERTRAEVALMDDEGARWAPGDPSDPGPPTVPAAIAAPRSDPGEEETRMLGPSATGTTGASGETAIVPRPVPRKLLLGAAGAVAVLLLVVLVASFSGDDEAEPADPLACASTTECRAAHGAPFFCDARTHRCESPLSDVCPEVFPTPSPDDRDAIVIGTILDRSTENQLARERAARLAVAGLNRAGGLDGRRVMLLHCDTSVADASEAAERLVRAGVPAIIGPSSSSDTAAVFSAHAADGVLVISPSATATQLGEIGSSTPRLLWRTAPPDSLQASVILAQLRDEQASSVVVVRRSNDVYAQSLSVIVQERAEAAGLTVARSQVFADDEGMLRAASDAIASRPDAVVFVSSRVSDAAAFLDAAASTGAYDDGVTIHLADASANDDLLTLTTSGARLFPQVRATRPAPPSTIVTSELVSEYMSSYDGEDPLQYSFVAHAYDATALVLLGCGYALGHGGELTGARIAEGIALASAGTTEHRLLRANFASIISALRSPTPDVDVVGASGPLDFDRRTGELTRARYDVLGITGAPPRFELRQTIEAN